MGSFRMIEISQVSEQREKRHIYTCASTTYGTFYMPIVLSTREEGIEEVKARKASAIFGDTL